MENSIFVIAIVLVVALLLYAGIARLLRKQATASPEMDAIRVERDRLVAELRDVRAAANDEAGRAGKLTGLLEAASAEIEAKLRQIEDLSVSMLQAQSRIEVETVAARTAASSLLDRDSIIDGLKDAARAGQLELSRLQGELTATHSELAEAKANLVHSQKAQEDLRTFVADEIGDRFVFSGRYFNEKAAGGFVVRADTRLQHAVDCLQSQIDAGIRRRAYGAAARKL